MPFASDLTFHTKINNSKVLRKVPFTQECNTSSAHGIDGMNWPSDHASFIPAAVSPVCSPAISWMVCIILEVGVALKAGNGKRIKGHALKMKSSLSLSPRLFVIDGVISLPVAISGFFVLPDVPEISNPWYLSKEVCLFHYTISDRFDAY